MTLHRHPASPILDHCPESLPASVYFDPAWYEREKKAIWAKNWVYVGRKNDLPKSTMRRIEAAGQNLILCRNGADTVTAFHNTCRHRGAELCSNNEKPMGKLITCPYHAWAYASADGRLVSVAAATPTDDFRRAEHGLFRVQVKEWNGFLFVCLADEAPEFTTDLGAGALDNWPMDSLGTGYRIEKDLACNWKGFWENYNECLHCPGVHPELCDLVPIYKQGIMAPNEAPGWTPEANDGPVLKEGASTWTMSGKPCGPEFPNLTPAQRSNGFNFVTVYPTMFIVAHVDYVRAVTLIPTGPETTRLTAEWFFPQATLDQHGFSAADVASFALIVMGQDCEVAEINQRGLKSPKFTRGRLMPQEFEIHNFHKWVMRQMTTEA